MAARRCAGMWCTLATVGASAAQALAHSAFAGPTAPQGPRSRLSAAPPRFRNANFHRWEGATVIVPNLPPHTPASARVLEGVAAEGGALPLRPHRGTPNADQFARWLVEMYRETNIAWEAILSANMRGVAYEVDYADVVGRVRRAGRDALVRAERAALGLAGLDEELFPESEDWRAIYDSSPAFLQAVRTATATAAQAQAQAAPLVGSTGLGGLDDFIGVGNAAEGAAARRGLGLGLAPAGDVLRLGTPMPVQLTGDDAYGDVFGGAEVAPHGDLDGGVEDLGIGGTWRLSEDGAPAFEPSSAAGGRWAGANLHDYGL